MATIKGHMNQTKQGTQLMKHTMDNMHPVHDYAYFATTDTTASSTLNKLENFQFDPVEDTNML